MRRIKDTPYFTYLLIGLNLCIYFVGFVEDIDIAKSITALEWGANFAPYTLNSQSWRLVSSMFLHFGIIHLIANMYTLYVLGNNLEKEIGSNFYLGLYLICGLFASATSIYWNLFVFSAGASGALFGIYGFEIVWMLVKHKGNKSAITSIFVNFIIYFAVTLKLGTNFQFDHAAHIGGMTAGALIAVVYIFSSKLAIKKQHLKIVLSIIFSFIFCLFYLSLPKYQLHYFNTFQKFIETDDEKGEIFEYSYASDNAFATAIKPLTLKYDSVATLFEAIDQLPVPLIHDRERIIRYIRLRKREIYYIVKGIEKESYIYQDSVDIVRSKFNQIDRLQYPLRLTSLPQPDTSKSIPPGILITSFYDKDWKETTENNASYYRRGFKDSLDRWNGPVMDFFINGQIQMKGNYKNDMKHGIFIFYSNQNTYESAGRCSENYNVGKWEYFHSNGRLSREVKFLDRSYVINAWDIDGNETIKKGNGEIIERHQNTITKDFINYKEGRIDSISYGYHNNGLIHYKEYYKEGILIEGESISNKGERANYDFSTYIPYPEHGMKSYLNYIEVEKNTAGNLKEKNAVVDVVFQVGASGEVYDIRVFNTDDLDIINFAKQTISKGVKWLPAKEHGLYPIISEGFVRINFP